MSVDAITVPFTLWLCSPTRPPSHLPCSTVGPMSGFSSTGAGGCGSEVAAGGCGGSGDASEGWGWVTGSSTAPSAGPVSMSPPSSADESAGGSAVSTLLGAGVSTGAAVADGSTDAEGLADAGGGDGGEVVVLNDFDRVLEAAEVRDISGMDGGTALTPALEIRPIRKHPK